jgi:hypothetical protein
MILSQNKTGICRRCSKKNKDKFDTCDKCLNEIGKEEQRLHKTLTKTRTCRICGEKYKSPYDSCGKCANKPIEKKKICIGPKRFCIEIKW